MGGEESTPLSLTLKRAVRDTPLGLLIKMSPWTETEVADPLSVFLSLKDDTDERVEEALEEMLRSVAW